MERNELIRMVQTVQLSTIGEIVGGEFIDTIINRLADASLESLNRAINDLCIAEIEPMQKMMALRFVMELSSHASDLEKFNETCNKWLTNDTFEAGVGKNGEIIVWDKTKPESRITLACP